jgi:hypothetical protein
MRRRAAKLRAKALIAAGEAASASDPAPTKPDPAVEGNRPVPTEQPNGNGEATNKANVQKSKN